VTIEAILEELQEKMAKLEAHLSSYENSVKQALAID
jgi:hypothetical protein